MIQALCLAVLFALSGVAAVPAAAGTPVTAAGSQAFPQQPQIINLNLMQALIAVNAEGLTGVFGFIPEQNASAAFAVYLTTNFSAMKRFVKKGEKDLKDIGAVNEWDHQAYLYLITLNNMNAALGSKQISDSWMGRIASLSQAPAVPLAEITNRRKAKGE